MSLMSPLEGKLQIRKIPRFLIVFICKSLSLCVAPGQEQHVPHLADVPVHHQDEGIWDVGVGVPWEPDGNGVSPKPPQWGDN